MNKKKLVEEWYPLVELVVNRMLQGGYKNLKQHRDDLISEGVIGLYNGIETFIKGAGSSEVSWYSRKIKTAIQSYIRDYEGKGGSSCDISIDDIQIPDEGGQYVDPDFEMIDKYEPEDEVRKAIYHRILMGGATYKDLAKEFGLTPQAVRRRKQKLMKSLKKQMEQDQILEENK
jgi:RNA polymerase sigma factor (sigma-70 family)